MVEIRSDIARALRTAREQIAAAAEAAGRDPASVTLVAVSKTHPPDAVEAAIEAGQTVFGENRVQEAEGKFAPLRERHPGIRLHLIGALQTNKAESAVRVADVIESLDRERLADALARAADRTGRLPDLLVQVNIGDEAQKAGVDLAAASPFIAAMQARFGARLRGLMCIPPVGADPAPYFARLASLGRDHGLTTLSIGMSGDFPAAIAAGSTHVRLGTAIFGTRPTPV